MPTPTTPQPPRPHPYLPLSFIVALSIIPVILWATTFPLADRFLNLSLSFNSLGQLAGIVGITLFAINILLSARTKILDHLFRGINHAYILHHVLGGLSFTLLLLHPLLISAGFIPISFKLAAQQLIPLSNFYQTLGLIALLILIALLTITFFIKLPYRIWHLTHKFLGLPLLLGALHGINVGTDLIENTILRWYLIILITAAFVSYTYRTLLGRWLVPKHTYLLKKITALSSDITELSLEPVSPPFAYQPGQFIFINFKGGPQGSEFHPFSISSSPKNKQLTLTVKALGDFTSQLTQLKPDTIAKIEGPYGGFNFQHGHQSHQIWIAGGIGVTPFLSMIPALAAHPNIQVDLYYSVRDTTEAIHTQYLQEAQQLSNFKFHLWQTTTDGRLSGEILQKQHPELLSTDFFICGPPMMMASLRDQLLKLQIPNTQIHTEEFQLL